MTVKCHFREGEDITKIFGRNKKAPCGAFVLYFFNRPCLQLSAKRFYSFQFLPPLRGCRRRGLLPRSRSRFYPSSLRPLKQPDRLCSSCEIFLCVYLYSYSTRYSRGVSSRRKRFFENALYAAIIKKLRPEPRGPERNRDYAENPQAVKFRYYIFS